MWSDGTPWQYENWFDSQPNNGGGMQTHVAMNFDSSGQWNDEYKNDENSYVCHYKGKITIFRFTIPLFLYITLF